MDTDKYNIDNMLSVAEIAKYLHVPPGTVDAWCILGYIPFHEINGVKMFVKEEVDKR